MGKYGNGITFGKACNMEKGKILERLKEIDKEESQPFSY